MQVSTLAWSDYIGRIGCGRVLQGGLQRRRRAAARHDALARPRRRRRRPPRRRAGRSPAATTARVTHLWVTRGLENREVDEVAAGDIVWLAGPDDITLGDTLAAPELERGRRRAAAARDRRADGQHVLPRQQRPVRRRRTAAPSRCARSRTGSSASCASTSPCAWKTSGAPTASRSAAAASCTSRSSSRRCAARAWSSASAEPEVITHRDAHGKLLEPHRTAHHRRARGVPGHRHPGALRAQGRAGQHARDRHGPRAARVHDLDARPHRLSLRLPHRDARPGRHELALHGLRPVARRAPRPRPRLARQPGGRRGRRLLAREPAAARDPVRLARWSASTKA